jgi:5-dehydro-2-deoxygluconokinase
VSGKTAPQSNRYAMAKPVLDAITVGRVSVDLYGQQLGGRLEDMASFAKYVGGCPANIAIGGARLGLKTALLSRVGDEQMGRYVREQLIREGVDVSGLATDPERLTALAILGIRDFSSFPLLFYRENCADMGLVEADIDEAFIASARAVVVTGTHFTTPAAASASRRAMTIARRHGRRVLLDIDYRPVLWGLTGHGEGENRFVDSAKVTAQLQGIVADCDVVVGTEEEIHIAGGSTDTQAALARLRQATKAIIVMKRGPEGCVAFGGPIPGRIEDGLVVPGFPVEVYNVLGAGDGFMSGFLRGYLRGESLLESCRYANACGALVVSRHGCSPASPTWPELSRFLDRGSPHRALRHDPDLEHIHWATTRRGDWPEICALAFDHRPQFDALAERHGQPPEKIAAFKALIYRAARQVAGGDPAFGILVDDRYGQGVLDQAGDGRHWVARPIEQAAATPLAFLGGPDVGLTLREWPVTQTVKCLIYWQPDDPPAIAGAQIQQLKILAQACRDTGHELLLELIANRKRPGDAPATLEMMRRVYALGIKPDWWKLAAPEAESGWKPIERAIRSADPYCRGVLLLGFDAPIAKLAAAFASAAAQPICKGFAVGRSIFAKPAEDWLSGRIDDDAAVRRMASAYRRLIEAWRTARGAAADGNGATLRKRIG